MVTQGKRWMSNFRSILRRSASEILFIMPSLWLTVEISSVLIDPMDIYIESEG